MTNRLSSSHMSNHMCTAVIRWRFPPLVFLLLGFVSRRLVWQVICYTMLDIMTSKSQGKNAQSATSVNLPSSLTLGCIVMSFLLSQPTVWIGDMVCAWIKSRSPFFMLSISNMHSWRTLKRFRGSLTAAATAGICFLNNSRLSVRIERWIGALNIETSWVKVCESFDIILCLICG